MSTLGGIHNFDGGPIDEHLLITLGTALGSRGPDGGSEYLRGSIGVVYRAFHTSKESRKETQPLVSRDGHILCWDGRLDNRHELTSILRDELCGNHTDAAIVMASYRQWGAACLPKIIGDFALSLWDPGSRALLLARDSAGPRPLFYECNAEKVIWSSELGALLDVSGIKLEVNDEYVAGYLTFNLNPGLTPYKDVHAVPPGHVATVQNGQVRVRRFWGPDPSYEIRYKADDEYEEQFRHLFREAVRCRMRVAGSVWASLSGGLDSSAIVCMADDILRSGEAQCSNLETVSFVYDVSNSSDERNFISCVEEKIGRIGYHVRESDYPPLALFPDESQISFPDTIDCHFARHKALFEAMDADGARVLLTGHGGDELLHSGVNLSELEDLLVKGQLAHLHHTLRIWSRTLKRSYLDLLWRAGIVPLLPRQLQAVFDKRSYLKLPPWFDETFVTRMRLRERYKRMTDTFGFNRPSARGQAIGYLSAVDLVCKAQYRARGGIEVSHPYLHRPLVEFLHAIPHEQKSRPGESRSLMRRALQHLLPEKVVKRKTKRSPEEAILRALAREWPRFETMFAEARVQARGYMDSKALLVALERARHGCQEAPLTSTISLEIWLRALEVRGSTVKSIAAPSEPSPRPSAVLSQAVPAGR